jgi:hypothetical protein
MTPAFDHYAHLCDRDRSHGAYATLTGDCQNDYNKDQLAVVPEGTVIKIDFAGDFGCYALADVGGVVHKVKIMLTDLHKISLIPNS